MILDHVQTHRSARYETCTRKSELGKTSPAPPVLQTEFEMQVERLQLTKAQYVTSIRLRRWCEHNRNRCYVTEWLLSEWGLEVKSIFSGIA
jgi:hypothetical protein